MSVIAPSIVVPPLPRLPLAVPRSGIASTAKAALRQLLGDLDRALALAFRDGADASKLAQRHAEAVQRVVVHVWQACLGETPGAALFAVGGFGRGLLFPYSDVDVLVLVDKPDPARLRALEQFFAVLWDLGLKPGHALREVEQCRQLASEDLSVFTSLLDARCIAGDKGFESRLQAIVNDPLLWPPADYLRARLAERDARHARFDDTSHNLEPNLKDGPGGLRSLDAMRWLGRRVAHAASLSDMVVEGLLDPAEAETLEAAEATLRRYRYALHLEAGRAEERLLFDYQRGLARRLGFEDDDRNLGVEQFMQGYYRAASQIERLASQLCDRFEEMLEPPVAAQPIGANFLREGRRLAIREADLFVRDPSALVDIFIVRLDRPDLIGFSAETMRRMHQAIALHGAALADDRDVLAAFRRLLQRGAPAVDALWRMNRHGLLAAILPAFGMVFGRMQYDLFHVYTVDEHTVRVLRVMARFADPAAALEFPLACEIWPTLPRPEVMLLAALFHDIAKGRGGDHSMLGEQDARLFGGKLGLPAADTERIAWLVRQHLLMSATAQRQDITDPEVVHRFAEAMGDRERLAQLYLLTVADIIGTSPKLWNAWKERLLADLYVSTRYALRSDIALPRDVDERVAACQEQALPMLQAEGFDREAAEGVWNDFPAGSFLRHRPEQIAWQTMGILRAGRQFPLVQVNPLSVRGSTELFIYTPDRDGLFATVTAVLDRMRFSVVEARILSSPAGMAQDTFLLLEAESQQPTTPARAIELQRCLKDAVSKQTVVMPVKRSQPRRLKHFLMPPRLTFSQAGERTQMALVCTDRPGLLAVVAKVLLEAAVRVHDARIATFGERVEDFFQLTDANDAPLRKALQQQLQDDVLAGLGAQSAG